MINTLIPIIEGMPDPLDYKDEHHTWLSPLKLKSTASSHPEFIQLVDQFVEASKGTRKSNHVKTLTAVFMCWPNYSRNIHRLFALFAHRNS